MSIADTCQYVHEFDGEWKNITGSDTIVVYFRSKNLYSTLHDKYRTTEFGWHEYKKGSTLIQSDYSHRFDTLPFLEEDRSNVNYSISLSFLECFTPLINLYGAMKDYAINNSNQNWRVKKINNNTLMVKQINSEAMATIYHTSGYTLPIVFYLYR